jgi:gliding motility-associated-like protein
MINKLSCFYFIFFAYLCLAGCVRHVIEPTPQSSVQLFVPTAFTPNGDGHNDTFMVTAKPALTYYHIRIYDNSNILLFESQNIKTGWDGNVKGQPEPNGSYPWIIEYQADGTEKFTKSGSVQLVR